MKKSVENIVKFLFEMNSLKHFKRSGWHLLGIKAPESIAEHSFGVVLIGYVLAKMENADADKVMKMCLFHDMHEARVGDINKVARRYIKADKEKIANEQLDLLSDDMREEMAEAIKELIEGKSKEAIVARDADLLELMIQAKVYANTGYKNVGEWLSNPIRFLSTESGKRLAESILESNGRWWEGLKIFD